MYRKNVPLKIFWVIFFTCIFRVGFSQNATIDMVVKNAPLSEVIHKLEKKYNYLFSYVEEDVQGIFVSVNKSNLSIKDFLKIALKKSGLEYEIVEENYIVLKRIKLDSEKISDISGSENKVLVCGSVVDSLTQKPLPFASVYLKNNNTGIYSADDGSFRFEGKFSYNDTVVISYVGYKEKQIKVRDLNENTCPEIQLNYFDFRENFIVVTDYLTDGIDLGDNGASTVLRPKHMGVLPGQAEPDVLNAIQFLPGISSPNGELSSMHMRGGASDQNLVLWEHIPVYHTAHYFGMISAFNPYIIEKASVYRGGFGPEYGGRASGVVDMESAGTGLQRATYGAGSNFLYAYAYGKAPVVEDKISVVYSLRRSLAELWRSPTFESMTKRIQQGTLEGNFDVYNLPKGISITDGFDFLDSHVKVSAAPSEKDEFSLAFFYGNNDYDDVVFDSQINQEQTDVLNLKNNGTSLSWKHKWSSRLKSEIVGLNTSLNYDYSYFLNRLNGNATNESGVKTNDVRERQFHFTNTYKTRNNHELELGYQLVNYDVRYQILHQSDEVLLVNETDTSNTNVNVNVIYGAFKTAKDKRAGVDIGFRINRFQKGKTNFLAPRFRFWYNLSNEVSLHANFGRYYQFVSQLVEFKGDFVGIDRPIWVLGGKEDVPVLKAIQYQAGLVFSKNGWVVDLQAYTKDIDGLTSLATGFDPTPQHFDIGNSSSKGFDLLVKKRYKNFRTWISYSLSKVEYHFQGFFDEDFAAPYDQRHAFRWASQLTLGKLACSVGYVVHSGAPYSLLEHFDIVKGPMGHDLARPLYDAYNDKNLPLQHHLDASFLYRATSKKNDSFQAVIGLSFFNILRQENIYSREYFVDLRRNQMQMPIIREVNKTNLNFLPNAVVRFEW